ncbi:MAG: relaxase/mobilization nuclease domain-containing protein [Cytophagales bacterium]|jgi:hypothetical protein|nr:relaxase/mobilization nuclease domain-containing protein [Cytophagales bacterium]MCA6390746.1 relaxase/mobilization nuclease domain-containing protein [Cytophagales bacterium]MCA6396971.1 relaxase/mobilization nuclease domain-containing protein [Cytophagales bacterium]MCA6403926.1 relaxase/mobilization nuclease domain-containing protein [Cytophagales bacterium]MCA6405824.1 relaxase/mobilization nuclease domain-containing protein [Cytophagales bacterium]
MISKVIIGSTFKGCCRYVMLKPGAEVLFASGVRADKVLNTITDFDAIRSLRPGLKKAVIHTSISFAYEDKSKLTDEIMIQVAQAFLKKIGLHENQAVCVKHTDAKHHDHEHFHINSSRVGYDGRVVSDKFIKNRAAKACDELEAEFKLTVARGHGLGSGKVYRSQNQNKVKDEIRTAINSGLSDGVTDFDELTRYLTNKGIEMKVQYQSTGRVNGISFRKDDIAFKGSSIDKSLSYRKLISHLANQRGIGHIENGFNKNKQIDYEK